MFDNIPLNLCLSPSIYKYLLGIPIDEVSELREFDLSIFHSLKYILENDINDQDIIEEYFVHDVDGKQEELTIGGKDIRVTD